jgi:hypothetical protein
MPEWIRLAPEDQEEIANKLTLTDLPEKARTGREIADLRLVLGREGAVAAIRSDLETEVRKRVPVPPTPSTPPEPPTEETVSLSDLSPPEIIGTQSDLDSWLSTLRQQIGELLRSNKVIRFRK